MPNRNEHRKKYIENRALLDKELSINTSVYYDWIVTVAFYATMHLVEGKLSENNIH